MAWNNFSLLLLMIYGSTGQYCWNYSCGSWWVSWGWGLAGLQLASAVCQELQEHFLFVSAVFCWSKQVIGQHRFKERKNRLHSWWEKWQNLITTGFGGWRLWKESTPATFKVEYSVRNTEIDDLWKYINLSMKAAMAPPWIKLSLLCI